MNIRLGNIKFISLRGVLIITSSFMTGFITNKLFNNDKEIRTNIVYTEFNEKWLFDYDINKNKISYDELLKRYIILDKRLNDYRIREYEQNKRKYGNPPDTNC